MLRFLGVTDRGRGREERAEEPSRGAGQTETEAEATSSSSRRMERGDHGGQQRQVVTGTAAANKQERSEQLDNFLLRRPSAAEVVEKGIIPRSVIDEGKASWQVRYTRLLLLLLTHRCPALSHLLFCVRKCFEASSDRLTGNRLSLVSVLFVCWAGSR